MKYQDFSSEENFVSGKDTIFIFHVWMPWLLQYQPIGKEHHTIALV